MSEIIWKSSQAIVIDRKRNIYLEDNKKIGRFSLIWWKVEHNKDGDDRKVYFENAMIREFEEETWIKRSKESFEHSKKYQEPQEIPEVGIWESMYYIIILETKGETEKILENKDINKYNLEELKSMGEDAFSMPKEKFLAEIERALNSL